LFYKAKTIWWLQVISLLLILLLVFSVANLWMLYYLIPLALFVFSTIFMDFKLVISDGLLTFQIRVFTLTIYKKTVSHKQVEKMIFKRVGWGNKCVIVKKQKGIHFRIINFSPKNIYHDLIEFANRYDIPIHKTKDYLILEGMNK